VQPRHKRNIWTLGFLLLLAGVYIGGLAAWQTLTGVSRLDVSLGILLGLFICSHPAANGLDMLLFMRAEEREAITDTFAGRFWLGLNALAFLAGWAVIFAGTLRFVVRAG
jgi:hypothetical protein